MKVFISWSGDRSKAVADVLRKWFPSVLQAVRPYFSPDDVAKGSRWSSEIAKELEASQVGLLVITPENQEAPWLLFEAGALAKNLDRSKVCPLLFGAMEPTDVKGPLVQFQAARFSEEEMKRVIKMMNAELAEAALPWDVLDNVFRMWWPPLEEQVKLVLEGGDGLDRKAHRADRELLEEVVALTRQFSSERRSDLDHPAGYVMQLKAALMSTVAAVTMLTEMRDPYTAGHSRRVADLAVAIGAGLGFDAGRQEGLRVAGHLHDIGKLNIPAEILSKPGKLTAIEWGLIKTHSSTSHDVLKGIEFPWPVARVALEHHERMDGSGYPQGLKSDGILLESRIMAVADVVEAMASHRPYRPSLGIDRALAEIKRGRGTVYDHEVVDACLHLFREKRYQLSA